MVVAASANRGWVPKRRAVRPADSSTVVGFSNVALCQLGVE
jgi:hypothetical protein